MAAEVVPQPGAGRKLVAFYHDVMAEMRRVTWPDMPQVRQLSVGVVLLSLFIGGVIAIMDVVLQQLLVKLPTAF